MAYGGWLLYRREILGSRHGWAIVAADTAQFVGFALYFHTMWPRIRPVGSQIREERGERF